MSAFVSRKFYIYQITKIYLFLSTNEILCGVYLSLFI
jgi:hypothetical protein